MWEVWAQPWFGYTVVQRVYCDGYSSGYRYKRNWLGMHKFFFTLASADAYAADLNDETAGYEYNH